MNRIKRIFAVLILCVMLFTASACKDEAVPFLKLSSVPSVTVGASTETVKRFFEHYNDTFATSDEYGQLVPFVGDVLEYKAEGKDSVKLPVYGLSTLDGRIVVDPVYDNVIKHELLGGTLYELLQGSANPELATTRRLITSDGRFMLELSEKQSVSEISGTECFAIARKGYIWRKRKKVNLIYYDFYNYEFKKLFTFDQKITEGVGTTFTLGNYVDGIAPVNVTITTETVEKDEQGADVTVKTTETYGYFMDKEGKPLFKKLKFLEVEGFCNDVAVVKDEKGLYGVLKADGKYLLKPEYSIINYNQAEGYFALGCEGYFLITDTKGEAIAKAFCENANIEVIGTESIIYKKTLKYSGKTEFFSATTGDAFTCKETGRFPDANSGEHGLFTCTYGSVTDIFGSDGVSVAEVTDFDEIYGVWGDYCVLSGRNGSKTAVVDLKQGTTTEWIDAKFVNAFDGKYLVLLKEGKYSLYNIATGEYELTDNDSMTVAELDGVTRLNTVGDGYFTVYGENMSVLMRCRSDSEVAK